MAVTRIKNNQITDTTIQANAKVVPYTVTSTLLANNLVYGSDLTVTGNLTVQGTSTSIDTTITTIEDPVILLASTQTGSPSVDIGFIGRRGTSPNVAFVWDESGSEFVTVFTSTGETNTTVTISSYANFHTGNANIGGNIVINGTTSLVGNLASANVTGNITGGNLLTAGIVSATGNITSAANVSGGNVVTGGLISATATITGGNLATGGTASATGNITGGNVLTAGIMSSTGNATHGNILTGGVVSATANITGGNVLTGGLVSATGNITSAANVSGGNVVTGGLISATATITGGNLATGGTISATANITGGNVLTGGLISATGNVSGGNLSTTGAGGSISGTGNITGGNILTGGVVSAAGNITSGAGSFFIGNGSQLTGVSAASAGFPVSSGTSNINATLNGNIFVSVGGTPNVTVFTTTGVSVAGTVAANGTITGGNLATGGTASATGNVTGGNVLTGGLMSATGNITSAANVSGGNLVTGGLVSATSNITSAANVSGGNILTGGLISATSTITSSANVIGGNITTAGQVSATANVTGGNVLTGGLISATSTITSSANVIGGNLTTTGQVSATANITGGNVLTGGLISAAATITGGNLATGGTASATGNITGGNVNTAGQVSATANITGGNVLTGGLISATATITGGNLATGGTASATGNITGGNVLTGGLMSATGNITGANLNSAQLYSSGALTITNASGNINLTPAGNLVLNNKYINGVSQPVQDNDAASKIYVDNLVSTQISYHQAVVAATTTTLATTTGGTITYTQPNGAANGVGALLTTTGSFNLIDTANVQTVGIRILVKNEANAVYNGIYTWANATNIVRSTDADEYGANSVTQLSLNDYFFVTSGNVNAGSAWIVDAPSGTITFGTSNISFAQFSQSQVYTAGNGVSINGTVISAKVDNNTTAFDGAGNIIVKAGANLTTPNIGAATGTSVSVTGTVSGSSVVGGVMTGSSVSVTGTVTGSSVVGGVITGTSVSVSGNVTGGNVNTGGQVSATANVTGGNVLTGGLISATGTITGGNLNTGGNVSATANITGGNVLTGGLISATSTITSGANITGGNLLTGGLISATATITGGNLATGGTISGTGNITGGNILTGGLISATGNVTSSANVSGGNIVTGGLISATSTITGSSLLGSVVSASGNVTGGNLNTGGQVSATANITGGNILTGGIVSTVGNINVGTGNAGYIFANAYYMTGLSAAVSVSKIVNGTSYANIASANGNLVVAIGASSNIVATFYDQGVNFTGPTSASGNVTGGNLLTGGLISATGNITGGNLISSGNVFATSAANVQFNDNTWFYSGYTTMNTGGIFHDTGANPDTIQVSTNSRSNGIAMWTNGVANSYIVSTGGFEFFTGGTLRANTNPTGGTSTAQITSSGLTVSGIISATANVTGGNVLTGGLISATSTITSAANVVGGNITTAGQVSATANITGGNVLTGGLISATATITGGNLATGGTVSATGNVTAGNLITAGNLAVNGGSIDSSSSAITINGASADVNFAVNGDTTTVFFVDAGTETASFGNSTQVTNSIVSFNSTNSIKMPVGNTAQRPTGVTGQLRFNTTTNGLEVFDNSAWAAVGTPTFTVISDQQFSGDGSTVAFTLSQASTTAGSVVSINGVVQIPTTAYSISSTTLTFTEAPATGDQIDVRTFTTTTSVTSISNSVGNAIISTSETAAQIDVTGNLIPTANVTYNLGSSSLRWKDLYLSGTSITLGNVVIKNVAGGNTVGFYGPDGTTPANIAASSVDTTQITSGTSNMSVVSSNGNIRANIAGTTVMTISPGLVDIVGNLTVSGNATLQGNILGDRVQNGTTSIDIQTPSGNANITIGGTSNVAVFTTTGVNITGVASASGNITGGNVLTGGLISATGNITGGNILGGANVNATTHTGTTVSVTANITGGNILTSGLISATGNINGGNVIITGILSDSTGNLDLQSTATNGNVNITPNGTGNVVISGNIMPIANATANIGSATLSYNTVFAKATSAQYADLAEKYTADAEYAPGTVVSFGGTAEVTVTGTDADRRVAGVVSTNPSYTMNSGLEGEHVVTVALTGRVPTQVIGLVRKGDMMVSAGAGRARAEADPKVGTVIGKALEDFNGNEGVIEVVVGRF